MLRSFLLRSTRSLLFVFTGLACSANAEQATPQMSVASIDTKDLRVFPAPDGKHFLTQSYDGLHWWNRQKAKILSEIKLDGNTQSIENTVAPVVNEAGTQLFCSSGDQLYSVDLTTGKVIGQIKTAPLDLLYWDTREKRLITVDNKSSATEIKVDFYTAELKTSAPSATLPNNTGVEFNGNNRFAITQGPIIAIALGPKKLYSILSNLNRGHIHFTDFEGDDYDKSIDMDTGQNYAASIEGHFFNLGEKLFSLHHDRKESSLYVRDSESIQRLNYTRFPHRNIFINRTEVPLSSQYSKSRGLLLLPIGPTVFVFDTNTFKLSTLIKSNELGMTGQNLSAFWLNDTSSKVFLADGSTFGIYDLEAEALVENFNQGFMLFKDLEVDPINGDLLAVDANFQLWRLNVGEQSISAKRLASNIQGIEAHLESASLAVSEKKIGSFGNQSSLNFSFPDVYPKDKVSTSADSDSIKQVVQDIVHYAPSGAYASQYYFHEYSSDYYIRIYDTLTAKRIASPKVHLAKVPNWQSKALQKTAICQDDAVIALFMGKEDEAGASEGNRLAAYDFQSRAFIWERPIAPERTAQVIQFDYDNALHVLYTNPLEYVLHNRDNGEVIESTPIQFTTAPTLAQSLTVSADFSTAFYGQGNQIALINLETMKVRCEFTTTEAITTWCLSESGDLLFGCASSGGLRIYEAATGENVAKLMLRPQTQEWVLFADDQRFDLSGSLEDELYTISKGQIYSAGQYMEQLHEPGLFKSVFANEMSQRQMAPVIGQSELPKVTLALTGSTRGLFVEDDIMEAETEQSSTSLTVTVSGVNIASTNIRLYHNGKLLGTGTRGLFVEDDDASSSDTFAERIYKVPLLPGENRFRALAVNQIGVESFPAEMTITSNSPALDKESGGIRLHMLFVGINRYQNSKYNLNYAVADAEALATKIADSSQEIYSSVQTKLLLDGDATRANIIAAFDELNKTAGPRDAFIFFFAGHGLIDEQQKREFYLATTELKQLYGDSQALKTAAISASELRDLSANLPAQKQLFILDACQSAEALVTIAQRGSAEEKAIAQLARSTGTHWLTASGSEQFATEFETLGHGVFTYALLKALDGAADAGDGLVSINELKAYLETTVPELTAEHRGSAQYPSTFGTGQDFPISIP